VNRAKSGWASQLLGGNAPAAPASPDEIPAARASWDLSHLNRDLPALAAVHERVVMRSRGGKDLTAEIYVPPGPGEFKTLLYLHGGGWCFWSPAHVRKLAMRIAARGYVVASLDYGLAPEHRFPWAVEDTVYAAQWLARNADRYRGKRNQLILAGDSAGANLAAAALVAGVQASLAGALLLYGVFDFPLAFSGPGADALPMQTTWNLGYLGPDFAGLHRNPLVSPVYAANIAAFPPCYLSCGDLDGLLPQTLSMARALTAAGVPATLSVVAGADHAFLLLADSMAAAQKELERICNWLASLT
jgi:acetyl esterase